MVGAHDRLDLDILPFCVLVQDRPLRVRGTILVPAIVLILRARTEREHEFTRMMPLSMVRRSCSKHSSI